MNQAILSRLGNAIERVENAILALRNGHGVLVADNEHRENETDLIFAAEFLTIPQTAMLIRECSGIICLCLPEEKVTSLKLPMMVDHNTNQNRTAFTISIEAATGVTTGVSAVDRVRTIKAAIADNAQPDDLNHPGHIFPLKAKKNGVLERPGHTEATVDLMRLAGLKPYGVLCELTKVDGTMMRLLDAITFAKLNDLTILTVEDLIEYRSKQELMPIQGVLATHINTDNKVCQSA